MEWISSPEAWVALATLTLSRSSSASTTSSSSAFSWRGCPRRSGNAGACSGSGFAMGTRILLLLVLTWIMRLQATLFTVVDIGISGRDLILIGGGLFLLAKSTIEIHESLEGAEHAEGTRQARAVSSA